MSCVPSAVGTCKTYTLTKISGIKPRVDDLTKLPMLCKFLTSFARKHGIFSLRENEHHLHTVYNREWQAKLFKSFDHSTNSNILRTHVYMEILLCHGAYIPTKRLFSGTVLRSFATFLTLSHPAQQCKKFSQNYLTSLKVQKTHQQLGRHLM